MESAEGPISTKAEEASVTTSKDQMSVNIPSSLVSLNNQSNAPAGDKSPCTTAASTPIRPAQMASANSTPVGKVSTEILIPIKEGESSKTTTFIERQDGYQCKSSPSMSMDFLQTEGSIDVGKLRNVHETRFRVIRDILKSQSETLDALQEFCNDSHRWMVEVDSSLRQQKLISQHVAPPMHPRPPLKAREDLITPSFPSNRNIPSANQEARPSHYEKRSENIAGGKDGGVKNQRLRTNGLPGAGNKTQASNELLSLIRNSGSAMPQSGSPGRPQINAQYFQRTSEWDCDSENDEAYQSRLLSGNPMNHHYGMFPHGGRGRGGRGRGANSGAGFQNVYRRGRGGGRGRKSTFPQKKSAESSGKQTGDDALNRIAVVPATQSAEKTNDSTDT